MDPSNSEKAISDLKKLIAARDKAVNEHEAAAAAAIISRLLLRSQLSEDEVLNSTDSASPTDPMEVVKVVFMRTNGELLTSTQNWQTRLLGALCRVHMCSLVFTKRPMCGNVFGRHSAVQVVEYMYHYLDRTLQEIATQEKRRMRKGGLGKRDRDWWISWYLGAVTTIENRLHSERRAVEQASTNALVLVRKHTQEANAMLHQHFPHIRTGNAGQQARVSDGFSAGSDIGRSVPLHRGVESGSSNTRQLT